jgi:iron complex transport system ATP-binding protein
MLQVKNVSVTVQNKPLLQQVSFALQPGQILAVLGQNGAGKSTLLQVLSGGLSATAGEVCWQGQSIANWRPQLRAKQLAVLSQQLIGDLPYLVSEVIALGAYPYRQEWTLKYQQARVDAVLQWMQLSLLSNRQYLSLSGGEKQRVQLARALLQINLAEQQSPSLLLLDEPAAYLDFKHQQLLLQSLLKLVRTRPLAVVMVVHDVNLALAYADQALLLQQGQVLYQGDSRSVLTADKVSQAFASELMAINHADQTWLVPVGKGSSTKL